MNASPLDVAVLALVWLWLCDGAGECWRLAGECLPASSVLLAGAGVVARLWCPVCHDPAVRRSQPFPRTGWGLLAVERERRSWVHAAGGVPDESDPLCPDPGAPGGYQPALPVERLAVVEDPAGDEQTGGQR